MAKQIFVVIEGTDGCGKKTQSEKLLARLQNQGINCIRQSFPDYDSPGSAPVKMYLNGDFGDSRSVTAKQANALFAVDRFCTMKKLAPHIENGGSIIFDRYVSSTMLHQAASIDNTEELDEFLDYVDNFEHGILKLPRPDIVFFLDVPVETSKRLANARAELKSGMSKDIHESDETHLQNAYRSGKYVANKYNWEVINCVDANGDLRAIEDINDEIYARCKRVLNI